MTTFTILAVIAVFLIVILWITHYLFRNGNMPDGAFKDSYENMLNSYHVAVDKYFTDPAELFARTIGYENDEAAKIAFDKAIKKEQMYTANEESGRVSKSGMKDAAMNSFVLANLYHYNIAPNLKGTERYKAEADAAAFFNRTINRIDTNPAAAINGPAEFMIDRAETFYNTTARGVGTYTPNFNRVRQNIREARATAAIRPGTAIPNKKDYFEPKPIQNDPQNVHDSEVTNEMKNLYTMIAEKNKEDEFKYGSGYEKVQLPEIKMAVLSYPFTNPDRHSRAIKAFDHMARGNEITSLNSTESKVLTEVWQRINSPENDKFRSEIRASFMDSLADSFDKNYNGEYHEVCTTGRCSRVLSSLTLMDSDPEISKPIKTTEILRNEVFSKAHQIIEDSVTRAPAELATAYRAGADTQEVKDFENTLRVRINDTIREEYSNSNPTVLDNIIKDAQAGI
jgi:hypothetical protein